MDGQIDGGRHVAIPIGRSECLPAIEGGRSLTNRTDGRGWADEWVSCSDDDDLVVVCVVISRIRCT
ncbi:hypothetical protein KIN20_024141 [Parelaphostrongylus tenuis]|uniref:Uncharacterized protein n=1 Tax=Parelaphostrongylus tenuis TaxID=148309 RepID=A0AAD5QWI8_PARTN|nr:hypothetical protein KIN20_024141 [Parelaphostrongylus tenuis]